MTQYPDEGWARPSADHGGEPGSAGGDGPMSPAVPPAVSPSVSPSVSPPPLPQASPVPLPPPPGYGSPLPPAAIGVGGVPTQPGPSGPVGDGPGFGVDLGTVGLDAAPAQSTSPVLVARRQATWARMLAAATAVLVLGVLGGAAGSWLLWHSGAIRTAPASGVTGAAPVVPGPAITRPANSVAAIAAKVLPSVVQIEVSGPQGEGTGSGFVMDAQGHVLTNNHVVSATSNPKLMVVFDDGTKVSATVVGKDASFDLAVLKADTGNRPALPFGDSEAVAVGDPVIAIGAPLGLQSTVTTGIVSAKNRPVSAGESASDASYINAIQTDAAINPGNSGGPLVDERGAVIGINSAIARAPGPGGGTGGNIGLGFAIPSTQAWRIAQMLITKGKAEYPIIGVSLDGDYDGEGVRVQPVATAASPEPVKAGGPADKAGIKPGDVITSIDGRPVTTSVELIVAIRAKAIGDTVRLTIRSGGTERTVSVTLVAASG